MGKLRRLGCLGCAAALLLVAFLPLLLAAALYLSFESAPRNPPRKLTPAEVERVHDVLDEHDPRRLELGEAAELRLTETDLRLGLQYAVGLLGEGGAAARLESERLAIEASLEAPANPFGRFLNLEIEMLQGDRLPRLESLRLGRLAVPAPVAVGLWSVGSRLPGLGADLRHASEMVHRVRFGERDLEISYTWRPELLARLGARLLPPEDRARLELYWRELASTLSGLEGEKRIALTTLAHPLFARAAGRSRESPPQAENRAVLLVLEAYVNGRDRTGLAPVATDWPRPRWRTVRLRGEWDLCRHFLTSAALAAAGGGALAEALGLHKELRDSESGSGFSFRDLAADRAGTLFGRLATGSAASARRLQDRMRDEPDDADLLPDVRDLPERLSAAELEQLGAPGSPGYRRLSAEIDRRIEALPLYRDAK